MEDEAARYQLPVNSPRAYLLSVRLDCVDLEQTLNYIRAACERRLQLHIATVNLNFLSISRRQTAFKELINNAGLVVTDGRILLWLTRLAGTPVPEQITGHDLLRHCLSIAVERNSGVFLLGGAPGVASTVADRLREQYPGLRVMGTDHGIFSSDGSTDRQAELEEAIRSFHPDFLFLALGTPKQEYWIARHLNTLSVPVVVGIGSVFDVVSGRLRRAPRWMQVAGLESVYQVLSAPRRYGKRYLVEDPPTLLRILFECLGRRFAP